MDFTDLLVAARKATGLTQEDVAKAVGLSRSHYSNIEVGVKLPPLESLDKLVRVLRLTDYAEDEFRRKALLLHTPTAVREMLDAYEKEATERDRQLKEIEDRLTAAEKKRKKP